MAKLTIESLKARIAADTTKLAELEAAEASGNALANLVTGDVVEFMFGRGETRKQRAGVVRAVYEVEGKKRIKVLAGEGADEELLVIAPDALVAVAADVTQAGAASADPLALLS